MGSTAAPSATGPQRTGGLTGLFVLPALVPVQAHQGEELIFILPVAMLLGTWLFVSWPSKHRPSEDSKDGPKSDKDDVTGENS